MIMIATLRALLRCTLLLLNVLLAAQNPPVDDSRQSLLPETVLGLLPPRPPTPIQSARTRCPSLPVKPANDRLEGPHGDSLVSTRCDVISFAMAATDPRWMTARYRWTSVFTAEDQTRGPAARDIVIEEEAVVFEILRPGQVRPVWHFRFEADEYGVWRSATPEIVAAKSGANLLGVMLCVNGTGGCAQEFLQRAPNGEWKGLRQKWLAQLPAGYFGRIRHGFHIDPGTLRGDAGLYGDSDPNCCPSDQLVFDVEVMGDSLVLVRQSVKWP